MHNPEQSTGSLIDRFERAMKCRVVWVGMREVRHRNRALYPIQDEAAFINRFLCVLGKNYHVVW